jgi:hypothetical protein
MDLDIILCRAYKNLTKQGEYMSIRVKPYTYIFFVTLFLISFENFDSSQASGSDNETDSSEDDGRHLNRSAKGKEKYGDFSLSEGSDSDVEGSDSDDEPLWVGSMRDGRELERLTSEATNNSPKYDPPPTNEIEFRELVVAIRALEFNGFKPALRIYGQYSQDIESDEGNRTISGQVIINDVDDIKNNAYFMQLFDKNFFQKTSKKVLACQLLMSIPGLAVSSPTCAFIMYGAGNALHIPTEGIFEGLAIAWIVGTTTSPYTRQYWNWGKEVGQLLFHEGPFKQHKIDPLISDEYIPKYHNTNLFHKGLKALFLVSAAVDSLIPLFVLINLESDYPEFLALTAAPFYLSWLKNTYDIGANRIDDLFNRYIYNENKNHVSLKKKILVQYLEKFQQAINDKKNCVYTHNTFNCMKWMSSNRVQNTPKTAEDIFGFSVFFLRESRDHFYHYRVGEGDEVASEALNLCDRLESVKIKRVNNKAVGTLGTLNAGISALTQYAIIESVLEKSFLWWGIDPSTAYYASAGLATFNTILHTATQFTLQQDAFKGYLDTLSLNSYADFLLPRKAAGLLSFINSAWAALPFSIQGLSELNTCPSAIKYTLLGSQFLNRTNSNNHFFSEQYNAFITSSLLQVAKKKNPPMPIKRAYLHHFIQQAKAHIRKLDNQSTIFFMI